MMKNFIIVAVLATLALSCQQKPQESETAFVPDHQKILKEISTTPESAYTKNGFRYVDAEKMVRNYKGVAGYDPSYPTKQNTRSVWFRLGTLDSLVTLLKLEREALQQGDPNRKDKVTDGVRIYFGRYQAPAKHPERNTVVFVSTWWVKNGNYHQDYFNNVKRFEPSNNGELSPPNNRGVSWDSHID